MTTTRRDFLKTALGASTVLSLGSVAPDWLLHPALAAPRSCTRDTVLVVLQLTGGNDGLNTLVPFDDEAYVCSRPTLRLPPKKVHRINASLGFHPRMDACARMFKEGTLAVVQGVGYPDSDRTHERAMRVWQTGDPSRPGQQTGWLGRVAEGVCRDRASTLSAALAGSISLPLALNAETCFVPSLDSARELVMKTLPGNAAAPGSSGRAADDALLDHLRRTAEEARALSKRIDRVLGRKLRGSGYPDLGLAHRLRSIAHLIRADAGIRIFYTHLGGDGFGGFDNHANQLGNHCALLHQLSESVDAFAADLAQDRLLDRVLLMTFSEFGRTLEENGRRGTGHGAAAPMLLVGGRLKGGLTGKHPSLTDLDNGALKFHIDFRRVYATVLEKWLALDTTAIPAGPFDGIDILD